MDGESRSGSADAGATRLGCRVKVVTGGASVDNGGVSCKVGGRWDSSILIY